MDGYDSGDTTKALLQLSPARLEQMVHTRFQGRQPPWIVDDDWEFHMRVLLDAESQKQRSILMPPADTRHPAYNGTKQRAVPLPIMVECSGLGGGDLSLEQPWHICIKTNKHRQQIYGPSLALVEETVKLDRSTVHVVALGLTKSLQEFLVLHYYATDSAKSWNALLHDWFPQVKWAPPGQIRCTAKRVYKTVHIAPSHRRAPHPCWTGPMQLLFSLPLGHDRMRYTSLSEAPPKAINVQVRGFSGSFELPMRAVYSVQLLVRPSCWSWSLVRCLTASCSCITKETKCGVCGNPLMTTRWLTALCM